MLPKHGFPVQPRRCVSGLATVSAEPIVETKHSNLRAKKELSLTFSPSEFPIDKDLPNRNITI